MELKVWVDGIQRVVCGVTEATTCQDVVYALAHATQQTGRFTLVERWRHNEKLLAPMDHPLRVLNKWGEFASDVHFVMRRSENSAPSKRQHDFLHCFSPTGSNKEIKKSLTFSGSHVTPSPDSRAAVNGAEKRTEKSKQDLPRGVVRGIPQQKSEESRGERPKHPPPYDEAVSRSASRYNSSSHTDSPNLSFDDDSPAKQRPTTDTAECQELLRLVAHQKEKLESQQSELAHYDAELTYWENAVREREAQLENGGGGEEAAGLEAELETERRREAALRAELGTARARIAGAEAELAGARGRTARLAEQVSEAGSLASRLSEQATVVEQLGREIRDLDTGLQHRRRTVSQLAAEIREANLHSLSLSSPTPAAPPDKNIIEGTFQSHSGSTRKIIGSPRQLETAVPTNKNPHGVWV